jgi:hypothetical protein
MGRRFVVPAAGAVLGSRPEPGRPAIDLSGQQRPESPRQVAPSHAMCEWTPKGLTLTDLGTPGGTFVNRVRVVRNQPRLLVADDVIQLGGVQLRVVAGSDRSSEPQPSKPAAPMTAELAYPLSGGVTCRSWDDFVRLSTQRWNEIRDELTSGRLAATLEKAGLGAFAPNPLTRGTPDERLDAWLQRIPSGLAARPELDVHPTRLEISLGGGPDAEARTTRRVQVSNTGYGLLRVRPRIDPPESAQWLQVEGLSATGERLVVESAEWSVVVTRPTGADPSRPHSARIHLDSNGGSQTIDVVLTGPRTATPAEPAGPGAIADHAGFLDGLRTVPLPRRLLVGTVMGLLAGLAVWAGRWLGIGASASAGSLGWVGPAAVFLLAGAALGFGRVSRQQSAWTDRLAGALAGACAGLAGSCVAVAASRVLGALLGVRPDLAALGMGPLLGLLLAAATALVVPPPSTRSEPSS